jgi:hypothetical protein
VEMVIKNPLFLDVTPCGLVINDVSEETADSRKM